MLVTEQDAVMKKWCPMIRLRWEARPLAFNRSNPGRSARFRNMMYRMFFPRLHHEMRGHFFRCQGSGCMMWRWETKDPPHRKSRRARDLYQSRTRDRLRQSRVRDIVVWQARPSRSLHSDVYRALRGAGPSAEIWTLFGRAAGQCHIIGRFVAEFTATITNSARQINASRAGNEWNADHQCPT